MVNKGFRSLKKMNMLNSKILKKKKIKSLFIIYANFVSIFVPKDNGKQYPEESYANKYQKTYCLELWL